MESGLLHPQLAEQVGQGRISLPDLQPPPYFLLLREKTVTSLPLMGLLQASQTAWPEQLLFAVLLKATPCSSQVWNISHLRSCQHHTAPFPPPALLCSHHYDLLSYPVHLQFFCFLSYRRVKEVAIYRPYLLSSPLLQQQKQLLPRSLIIYNLLLA